MIKLFMGKGWKIPRNDSVGFLHCSFIRSFVKQNCNKHVWLSNSILRCVGLKNTCVRFYTQETYTCWKEDYHTHTRAHIHAYIYVCQHLDFGHTHTLCVCVALCLFPMTLFFSLKEHNKFLKQNILLSMITHLFTYIYFFYDIYVTRAHWIIPV